MIKDLFFYISLFLFSTLGHLFLNLKLGQANIQLSFRFGQLK